MRDKIFVSARKVANIFRTRDRLNKIDCGLGDKFINRINVEYFDRTYDNDPDNVLVCSFDWSSTLEGFEFWNNVHNALFHSFIACSISDLEFKEY